jgi:phenylalanyl-tRNA synthetase beta subunit
MFGFSTTATCAWFRNSDMKYSLEWLKRHIDGMLPPVEKLVPEITEKAFEIEGTEVRGDDTVIEAKVLPDRAHDALSHRGMAREIAALFGLKRKDIAFGWPKTDPEIIPTRVSILDPDLCFRYIGVRVDGVSSKESPKWLRERLEAVGQRSINALVDITNFVMFDIGQPMHAFDARKVKGGITVRLAKKGEIMTTLDGKALELDGTELVIADDEAVLALAGVKGGKKAEVDARTTSIILESANFDPTRTRLTSVKHAIRTDASKRYENGITSSFAEEGAKEALALLLELYPNARVADPTDVYPRPERAFKTGVSQGEIRKLLGVDISMKEIIAILERAGMTHEIVSPRARIVELAESVIDRQYKIGASVTYDAPEYFDCSSLIAWLYKEAGISIPRVSVDQFVYSRRIEEKDLRPGDLVFTNSPTAESGKETVHFKSLEWLPGTPVIHGIDHVAVYVGDGQIIHATKWGGRVRKELLVQSERFAGERWCGRIIETDEERIVITVPPERLDLRRSHDCIEEIGRRYGYNKIPATLPKGLGRGRAHKRLYYSNIVRKFLIERGFSEVYTYSFAKKGEGDIEVMNPVGQDRPFVRRDLSTGIFSALVWNMYHGPLIGAEDVRIFEFGNVFGMEDGEVTERFSLVIASAPGNKKRKKQFEDEMRDVIAKIHEMLGVPDGGEPPQTLAANAATLKFGGFVKEMDFDAMIADAPEPSGYDPLPNSRETIYRPVSSYPFVTRDISLYVPVTVPEAVVESTLRKEAGDLVVRFSQFDRFHKDGEDRISYGYRFVFQSFERTLTDEEVNAVMERVYAAARAQKGWETR